MIDPRTRFSLLSRQDKDEIVRAAVLAAHPDELAQCWIRIMAPDDLASLWLGLSEAERVAAVEGE
jgi:hypothetical protein